MVIFHSKRLVYQRDYCLTFVAHPDLRSFFVGDAVEVRQVSIEEAAEWLVKVLKEERYPKLSI
jgi:hypothetical protein